MSYRIMSDTNKTKLSIVVKKRVNITAKPTEVIKVKIPSKGASSTSTWLNSIPSSEAKDVAISFDVGIVNLAYCVMKLSDKSKSETELKSEVDIFDWNILKLADGKPKLVCSVKLATGTRAGQICGRKAYYISDSEPIGKGKGCCKVHGNSDLKRNVTVENVTEWELKHVLFKALDSDPIFLNVDHVLVESQPNKAREKIKGIGHALSDYYVLRGTLDNNKAYKTLKFIDAKNKLTVYDGPPISCHLKTQYCRNKWYAIRYCQWIIRHNSGLLKYFETYGPKKDDLADCMLQGLWYLKYGCKGEKAPTMSSSHQKLVYRENNRLQYKKVRARAPQKKQVVSGRYTLSNIKYLLKHGHTLAETTLMSSVEYYFGDVEYFEGVLKNV
jgi:hypothetical protein